MKQTTLAPFTAKSSLRNNGRETTKMHLENSGWFIIRLQWVSRQKIAPWICRTRPIVKVSLVQWALFGQAERTRWWRFHSWPRCYSSSTGVTRVSHLDLLTWWAAHASPYKWSEQTLNWWHLAVLEWSKTFDNESKQAFVHRLRNCLAEFPAYRLLTDLFVLLASRSYILHLKQTYWLIHPLF